jgi:hypothetical protein
MGGLAGIIEPIIGLIFHSAMVGVGNSYTDGSDPNSDCKLQACYFLKVAGGFLLALDILEILVTCIFACKDSEDSKGEVCGGIKIIGSFVIFIWGSVIIFGPYQDWTYNQDDKENKTFCEYTPYMFSFVILILGWISIPLKCCAIFAMICASK